MSVTVAKHSGFCFGVARAVKLLEKCLDSGVKTYSVGQIIHNPVFNERARARGLIVISEDDIDSIEKDSAVIIRSHGVKKEIDEKLRVIGCTVIDATCPDVKKIHKIINANTDADTLLIIIGNKDHPEVAAAASYAHGDLLHFSDSAELSGYADMCLISKYKCVIMVAQTTHSVSDYEKCKVFLKKVYTKAKIFDTICSVTESRQREAEELSAECDAMLIIGGRTSSNTLKLFDICKRSCQNTFLVENVSDVPPLDKELDIGIVAGASTPDDIIEEVTNKCRNREFLMKT